ncbi:MAG: hypothetical protein GF317_00605 [Candidatus Lokiarchaeota archaeon]|nr:hypothetical protein [Candidatus Lokiarchaeota archaeon]MBD3198475.1 hypothetical protein [Candidatus Lokiarchaeota archaeon]
MEDELTALERINIVLEGGIPDRVPSLCLGSDFKFIDLFMKSSYALTEEDLEYFSNADLSPRFLHTQQLLAKFSPKSIYPNGLDAKIDLCWEIVDGVQLRKGESQDTFITPNGQVFKFIINDDGIPSYWYTGPSLDSKEKIINFWEHSDNLKVDKNRFRVLAKNRKKMKKFDIVVAQGIGGPFENGLLGIGYLNFAKLARKEPEIIKKHIDFLWENYQKKNLRFLLKTRPDLVMIGNDIGHNDGLQLPLKHWQKFFKPILKKYVEMVHDAGVKFIVHCCGAIEELFPDFVEIGVDGVDSLQPTINDLEMYRKKFPEITLLGTIDDTDLLVNATPEEVRRDMREKIKNLGKKGGYIPGPTNWLLDQKPENIVALFQAIREFGVYD